MANDALVSRERYDTVEARARHNENRREVFAPEAVARLRQEIQTADEPENLRPALRGPLGIGRGAIWLE